MINALKIFLKNNALYSQKVTLLVGFSGGFDSCALLHMLSVLRKEANYKLCAAHLNHGWRADSADNDEINCSEFCKKHNIEFYTEKLGNDIPQTETAAREARYKFFERAAKHFNTNIILTAHTKSDNVETLIYRVAKGTGIYGLCGIEPQHELNGLQIFRPLLSMSRQDIENYCQSNDLSPNNDESNFDIKYKRNFIRHQIIPQLKKINDNAESAINTLIENAVSDNAIINEYLQQIKQTISIENKYLTPKFLEQSKEVQQRLILDFVTEKKLDYDKNKIQEILTFIKTAATHKAGKTLSLTSDLWLFCSAAEMYPIKNEIKNTAHIKITDLSKKYKIDNFEFYAEPCDIRPKDFPLENENYAYVDLSNQTNLEIRYRKDGDRIQPFGMKNSIKLKDFFINKSIPQHKKDKIVLLCNQDEVLWACNVGLNEKLRVTSNPTHIIRIEEV